MDYWTRLLRPRAGRVFVTGVNNGVLMSHVHLKLCPFVMSISSNVHISCPHVIGPFQVMSMSISSSVHISCLHVIGPFQVMSMSTSSNVSNVSCPLQVMSHVHFK